MPITAVAGLDSLGWFDLAGLSTLAVFALLGVWKGIGWQIGRLLVLVAAYAVAIAFADRLAPQLARWFTAAGDPEVPRHVAHAALFVGVVALVGLAVWLVQRFRTPQPVSGISRLLGAGAGLVVGSLVMLAVLTGLAMFLPGRGVARAAESSQSARVGRGALEVAERVLPASLRDGARRWRELLVDPAGASPTEERSGGPNDGTFQRSDGATPRETPGETLPPRGR